MHILYLRNCQDLKPEEVFLLVLLLSKAQIYQKPYLFFFSFFVLFWGGGVDVEGASREH